MTLEGKVISITWWDITDHADIMMDDILSNPSKEYFTERTSTGRCVRQDKYGIVLVTDEQEDGKCEITAIPKNCYCTSDVKVHGR